MLFIYAYQTALVQILLSNFRGQIMDQERHGNVKIVKNASITKMFAITKLSVLMAVTKWNAVSILDIFKSILQFHTSNFRYIWHTLSLHFLIQCGMDDKSSLNHRRSNATVTNATKITFVLTLLTQMIVHGMLLAVCAKLYVMID